MFDAFEKCIEMAVDHNQADVLSSLAGDIDVQRYYYSVRPFVHCKYCRILETICITF